jgi:PAS domain S-box-containing protein
MTRPTPENTVGKTAGESDSIGQMFTSAIGVARLPMLLTDPRQSENPIVFANQAFSTLTGYDMKEVLGRNCRFLQGPGTDPTSVATLKMAIGGGHDVSIRLLNYRKDGGSFWNALHISPILGADGSLLYFFSCQVDVSHWRAAENATAEAQRLQILSQLILEKGGSVHAPPVHAGSNIAALRRWREMERFASFAESNLARRELALVGGQPPPALDVERLLAKQLRDAAVRARIEAFDMLAEGKDSDC